MASDKLVWILFGLFIQYQLMAADKPTDDENHVTTKSKDKSTQTDETENIQNEDRSESSDISQQVDFPDIENIDEYKRGYGKWKNLKWSQRQEKRNIGRWKNRQWNEMQSYGLLNSKQNRYGHSLSKRFSESGLSSDESPMGLDGYGILNGDYIVQEPFGYVDDYGSEDGFDDIPTSYIDKRPMSRWNLIHRKLAALQSGNKRGLEPPLAEKRMVSRWRLIHNKLNQLHDGKSK